MVRYSVVFGRLTEFDTGEDTVTILKDGEVMEYRLDISLVNSKGWEKKLKDSLNKDVTLKLKDDQIYDLS
jgi:hypothetical protein